MKLKKRKNLKIIKNKIMVKFQIILLKDKEKNNFNITKPSRKLLDLIQIYQ